MDRETISTYGWIVVAAIALAIMVSLGAAFGLFVDNSLNNTIKTIGDDTGKTPNNANNLAVMQTEPFNKDNIATYDSIHFVDSGTYTPYNYIIGKCDSNTIVNISYQKNQKSKVYMGISGKDVYVVSKGRTYLNDSDNGGGKNLFKGASKLKSISLDNLDTSRATNFSSMFEGVGCMDDTLSRLTLGGSFNTKLAINMNSMFKDCSNLKYITLGNYFNTENVNNMSYMFSGTLNLITVDLGSNFNTSKVSDLSYMFNNCGKNNMTLLNLGKYFDTSSATNLTNTFYKCGYSKLSSVVVNYTKSQFESKCARLLDNKTLACFNKANMPNLSGVQCTDFIKEI